MDNQEEKVSTPHNNFVVVSQEDNNPLPSSAEASPQICLVQSSDMWEQSSANAMIWEKKRKINAFIPDIFQLPKNWKTFPWVHQ